MPDPEIQDNVIQHAQADMANIPGATGQYQSVIEPTSSAPSTESVLWAQWREGLKDLQNAVLDPWSGYAGSHEEIGTIANPTQIEVTKDRDAYHAELDQIGVHARQQSQELEM